MDITIIGGELFAWVAGAASLYKKDFHKLEKTPRTYYVREPFHLNGSIDLDISFNEKTMKTTVYVKMDAQMDIFMNPKLTLNGRIYTLTVGRVLNTIVFQINLG